MVVLSIFYKYLKKIHTNDRNFLSKVIPTPARDTAFKENSNILKKIDVICTSERVDS